MVRAEKTPVKITDNIVPWMEAVLLVQDHPFMAVTDRDGRFTIKGLPVGKELEFQLWHERMGYLSGTWLTQSQVAKVDTKGRFKLKIENGKNDLGAIHVGAAAFREGHK